MSDAGLTPMMQQYRQLRQQIPRDALLLFRLGDFYELFFEDAQEGSRLLDLALTQRQGIPMCGMPHSAAESYIAKLIQNGRRVAICDQVEAPRPGQIVRREVTQIISPGSVLDSGILHAKQNNFCGALLPEKGRFGLACLDLSTGEFQAGEADDAGELQEWLLRFNPSEIITPANAAALTLEVKALLVPTDGWAYQTESALFTLRDHFKTQSLDGFGLGSLPLATGAAGALLYYLAHDLRRDVQHVRQLTALQKQNFLVLDAVTQRNLELVDGSRGAKGDTSLLAAIDRTVTAGGGRLLRQWLLQPLRQIEPLVKRQEAVVFWQKEEALRESVRRHLGHVRDLERLLARLSQGSGNARDLLALRESLAQLPNLKSTLAAVSVELMKKLDLEIQPRPELVALLTASLADEPPPALKDGGLIRLGFRTGLDELRAASTEGKEWLAQLQTREQERTGIKSLKIRYNQVFGYYIEITKTHLDAVPADYTRKQTMTNAERFITPELKEMEGKILGAEERARQLEYEIFLELRQAAVAETVSIQGTARALHTLDVLLGWGALAQEQNYVRPVLLPEVEIRITDGRHPVLEQWPSGEKFVPNDAHLITTEQRLLILTGPNMAGKSTFIRQVALIALLAHTGCSVPARHARIGLLDRIFTRVGASDDLSRGQSTFMVEMNETANILHHATERSLVILDEIGRGTSTFDGLSIAWAVAEHLHDHAKALTLFATHYHELTELAVARPGVKNFSVAVREWNDQVIFLHKIIPGGADKSYGIQVARLAGLPNSVITRAQEILRHLEDNELDVQGRPKRDSPIKTPRPAKIAEAVAPEFDLFKLQETKLL